MMIDNRGLFLLLSAVRPPTSMSQNRQQVESMILPLCLRMYEIREEAEPGHQL